MPDASRVRGCYACEHDPVDADSPLWERLYVGSGWRIAHTFDSALPGWLVLLPQRHILGAHELTTAEAAEFGELVRRASIALVEVTGCLKTYVALFAEAEGFAHLHVHLVPRYSDMPVDRRGPAAFGYLGAAEADRFGGHERDDLARRLAEHLNGGPRVVDRWATLASLTSDSS